MWTAKITTVDKESRPGQLGITIEYTDGIQIVTRQEWVSEPNTITAIISRQLQEFMRLQAVKDYQPPQDGVVVLTSNTPTPEQLAAQAYFVKRQSLISAKQDLELGIIEQVEFDSLLAETKSLKP